MLCGMAKKIKRQQILALFDDLPQLKLCSSQNVDISFQRQGEKNSILIMLLFSQGMLNYLGI